MVSQWWTDEDMGHGFLVPVAIAWIIWSKRERLPTLPARGRIWGTALLAVGLALQIASALGLGLFAGSLAFLISLLDAAVTIGGIGVLRVCAFPILLSLFMLPKLAIAYNYATLPLQLLTARMAAVGLVSAGFNVLREGTILLVNQHSVGVEEACNGVRFLLPMEFLALAYGYAAGARISTRIGLAVTALGVALVANAARVAVAALYPAFAFGVMHTLSGWLIFMLALPALVAAKAALDRIGDFVRV